MPAQRHVPESNRIKVRQRSRRACAPCSKRKTKCDGTEPCAACVGYGYDCTYSTRSAGPQGSSAPISEPSPIKSPPQVETAQMIPVVEPASTSGNMSQKVNGLYMSQETLAANSSLEDPSFPEQIKTRFTSAYSATAWPRRLGISLGLPNPPRLQAFAWNPCFRPEPLAGPMRSICDIISLDQMKIYAKIYFKEVHPFFGFLDPDLFELRANEFWTSRRIGSDFEACVCGVIALGSYFSKSTFYYAGIEHCPVEAEVVEHARLLLDASFSLFSLPNPSGNRYGNISFQHVAAWTLRSIYTRLTTRPSVSWTASCIAMHLADMLGLHREVTECPLSRQVKPLEVDLRRRTFWVTQALNQFWSSEYGRSQVTIDAVSCHPITPKEGDFTASTVSILQSVSANNSLGRATDILEALDSAMSLTCGSPFLAVLKVDACFSIYRVLCSTNARLNPNQITSLLDVIKAGLDGSIFLKTMSQPWWNIVSAPFQSTCVLLSIGTPESLAMIPRALQTLQGITTEYDSPLAREALLTARALVQGARDKRVKELESLDCGLGEVTAVTYAQGEAPIAAGDDFDWPPAQFDLGFSDFLDLEPYYTLNMDSQAS